MDSIDNNESSRSGSWTQWVIQQVKKAGAACEQRKLIDEEKDKEFWKWVYKVGEETYGTYESIIWKFQPWKKGLQYDAERIVFMNTQCTDGFFRVCGKVSNLSNYLHHPDYGGNNIKNGILLKVQKLWSQYLNSQWHHHLYCPWLAWKNSMFSQKGLSLCLQIELLVKQQLSQSFNTEQGCFMFLSSKPQLEIILSLLLFPLVMKMVSQLWNLWTFWLEGLLREITNLH
ncbi:hypothetical protein O6P43_001585 [Quillaja saponaria]|uniref:Uncharacterized protein n=1 Tax=Quillaja saponaria TaxID=32244 RepID=A0AAD7VP86_QUISA|nr:hypothetical protein O6P43_001585 [Quillaja saponaria]